MRLRRRIVVCCERRAGATLATTDPTDFVRFRPASLTIVAP
jgi:hypothetical protein